MEDNGIDKKMKLIKWIVIILAAIVVVTITIVTINKNVQTNKKINYLENEKYEEKAKNIYTKHITNDNGETYYMYDFNNDKFSKDITVNNPNSREYIILSYSNKTVNVIYTYQDTKGCELEQTGEYKNEKFDCNVEKNTDCELKCKYILELAKDYKKEVEKDIKEINSKK